MWHKLTNLISWHSFKKSRLKTFLWEMAVIAMPYGWHILFFVVPFLMVLKLSFSESIIGSPPYTNLVHWLNDSFLQIRLNIGNYTLLWQDELYLHSYLESLKNAGIATIGCLLIGYPLAYGITRATPLMRIIFLALVILPFWTSFLVRVYSWIGILSNTGLLNSFLMYLGIIKEPLPLLNNNFAVTLGLIYSYLPFMVMPLYTSLEKINPHYIEAAYDLGCKPLKAFFKIIIPLSYRGILGGSMLVFIPAVGEYVIPALLGGANSLMVGRVLWNEFFTNHDWPVASALVITLFMFLVVPIIIVQRFTHNVIEEGEA
jgi:putrescine transport system permease protein